MAGVEENKTSYTCLIEGNLNMRVFKTTWTDRDGNKVETRKWYIEFRDHLQIIRRLTAFTDKSLSEALGRKIMQLVNYKIAGCEDLDSHLSRWLEQIPPSLRDRFVEYGLIDNKTASGGKFLHEHIKDFKQSLLAKGNTTGYVDTVTVRAQRVIDGCGFRTWTDISASQVEQYLHILRKNGKGISNQTNNFYLQAIKQFCKWMVADRRTSRSPVDHLTGLNVRTDRRHDRRSLEPKEIKQLLETTNAEPNRFNMSGNERAFLYRLAIETGLRRNELKSLTVSSFDFDKCTVKVAASYSKHRKEDILPLKKETALELKQYINNKLPNVKAFKIPYKTANMLKEDLKAANIPYVDESGRYVDFHSLRHSTGSLLASEGVHPKIIQSIMRHSDINLTMSRYTHIFKNQESEAIAKLPDLSFTSNPNQNLPATGTN